MAGQCEGMVALVTGASQGGSGTGLAVRLAAEGAKVGITARSREGLERTRQMMEELGGEVLVMPCDLGEPDGGRETLVARTEEAFGPLDILVNEPVSHELKPVHEWTLDELRRHAELNIWSYWLTMAQVIPGMRERGRGWILNFTSFSGELPPGPPFAFKAQDGSSMYGATKAAINRVTVSAAAENYAVIAVNALTPQVAGGRAVNSEHVPSEGDLGAGRDDGGGRLRADHRGPGGADRTHRLQPAADRRAADSRSTTSPASSSWRAGSLQDLIENIKADEKFHAGNNWPEVFEFHRPNTPYPEALRNAPPGVLP